MKIMCSHTVFLVERRNHLLSIMDEGTMKGSSKLNPYILKIVSFQSNLTRLIMGLWNHVAK